MLSKNANNKKCAPKLIFFNEKKIEKDWDDFRNKKLTLKVKFWHFLTPPHYTNSQNSRISFGYVDFQAKIFLILYPPFENSTTRIAILHILDRVGSKNFTWNTYTIQTRYWYSQKNADYNNMGCQVSEGGIQNFLDFSANISI